MSLTTEFGFTCTELHRCPRSNSLKYFTRLGRKRTSWRNYLTILLPGRTVSKCWPYFSPLISAPQPWRKSQRAKGRTDSAPLPLGSSPTRKWLRFGRKGKVGDVNCTFQETEDHLSPLRSFLLSATNRSAKKNFLLKNTQPSPIKVSFTWH